MSEAIHDVPKKSAVQAARDLVVAFSRLRRRLREEGALGDLTPSQTSVLSRLSKEGAASASALADAEHVRPQSMAATLAALDQRDDPAKPRPRRRPPAVDHVDRRRP